MHQVPLPNFNPVLGIIPDPITIAVMNPSATQETAPTAAPFQQQHETKISLSGKVIAGTQSTFLKD